MTRRIEAGVTRGAAVSITVDGVAVTAFAGETVAAAMLAADLSAVRTDSLGMPRGLFCNMGTCGECFVSIAGLGTRRACLEPVAAGMIVRRRG